MVSRRSAVRALGASVDVPTGSRDKINKVPDQRLANAFDLMSQPASRTAPDAMGVDHSNLPGTDAGALGREARRQANPLPRAVCFPRDDPAFADHVQGLFAGAHADRPFAAAVQALLRETYPQAVISPRHELADHDGGPVCYAFRDGSAVPATSGEVT